MAPLAATTFGLAACALGGSRAAAQSAPTAECVESFPWQEMWTRMSAGTPEECVSHSAMKCINDNSSYWPKCSPDQAKSNPGPAGYEFGHYCDEAWAAALNEVLADPVVDKCGDQEAVRKFLAQVAYETGYYSTVYQPRDGGAGLIHMIPANWDANARDMDALWPGHNYTGMVASMGKTFFQTADYGWRSVAAWFKRTNGVIPGCGEDLFEQDYERQTQCILSFVVDRSEAYSVVERCLASFPVGGGASVAEPTTATPATVSTTPAPAMQETSTTMSAGTPAPAPSTSTMSAGTPAPAPSTSTLGAGTPAPAPSTSTMSAGTPAPAPSTSPSAPAPAPSSTTMSPAAQMCFSACPAVCEPVRELMSLMAKNETGAGALMPTACKHSDRLLCVTGGAGAGVPCSALRLLARQWGVRLPSNVTDAAELCAEYTTTSWAAVAAPELPTSGAFRRSWAATPLALGGLVGAGRCL